MKTPLFLLLVCSTAFAAPRTSHSTVSEMRDDVKDFSRTIQGIEGCDFQISETAEGGLVVTMKNDRAGNATLEIAPNSQITLETGDDREDGSFSRSYKVQGAGELDVVHANDAFDHAFLTDREGHTLACEIDY